MYRILVALILLCSTTAAHGMGGGTAPARPVVVVNDPLQVEVINPPGGVQDVHVVNQPAVQDVNVLSSPPPAVCPEPERYQLVGFTTAVFMGDEGILGFAEACQLEFSESRMCTSVEVMETISLPVLPSGTNAWVRPVFQPISSTSSDSLDASGVSDIAPFLTCSSWRASNSNGLAVDSRGRFLHRVSCSDSRSVACCGWVAIQD